MTNAAGFVAEPRPGVKGPGGIDLFNLTGAIWAFVAVLLPAFVGIVWVSAGGNANSPVFALVEQGGIVAIALWYGPVSFLWAAWAGNHRAKSWLLASFTLVPLGVVVVSGITLFAMSHFGSGSAAKSAWAPFFIFGAIGGTVYFLGALGVGAATGSYVASKHHESETTDTSGPVSSAG
jgi:hypothetical protein